jgi:hypothetical protein
LIVGSGGSDSELGFWTNQYGASRAERMTITRDGKIGMGTTAPSYRLQIAGASAGGAYFGINTSGAAANDILNYGNCSNAVTGSLSGFDYTASASTGFTSSFVNSNNSSGDAHSSFDVKTTGASGGDPRIRLSIVGVRDWCIAVDNSDSDSLSINASHEANNGTAIKITTARSVQTGIPSLATNATDGFLYIPACAGTPTGTPTAVTGMAPLVVDSTNNKLYFYSGGAWRDAGP